MFIPIEDLRFIKNYTLSQIIVINEENNQWVKMDISLWENIMKNNINSLDTQSLKTLYQRGILANKESEYEVYKRMHKDNADIGHAIIYNVTNLCNLKCPYCFNTSHKDMNRYKLKSVDQIISDFDKLFHHKIYSITLSGGEPFLYDSNDLVLILKHAKKITGKVGINTNGTILPERIKEIIDICDTISVSLDGFDEDTNKLTRGIGSFEKTIKFLSTVKMLNSNKKLWLSVTASLLNYRYIPKILDIARELKIDVGVNYIFELGSAADNCDQLRITEDIEAELRKDILIYAEKIGYPKFPSMFYFTEIMLARKTCTNANMLYIDESNVYPCPGLKSDKFKLGTIDNLNSCINNVVKRNLEELKSFDKYKYNKCQNCSIKFFCGGGCYAMDMSDLRCDYYKKHISFLLWDLDAKDTLKNNLFKYGKNNYDIQVF